MANRLPARKRAPLDVETAILAKSARRCALCFQLEGDLREKLGQIAHLDGNRSNNLEDNLAWMCLPHHSLFDSRTRQHKNYTIQEVKDARGRLYRLVAEGKHLSLAAAQPYLQADADKKVLRDLLRLVPSNGSIKFLRTQNFAGFSFDWRSLDDIERFLDHFHGPDHEFLDPELESGRRKFSEKCRALLLLLATDTFPTGNGDRQTVPSEWEIEDPERFYRVVGEIGKAADSVCASYDELVRLARKRLAT